MAAAATTPLLHLPQSRSSLDHPPLFFILFGSPASSSSSFSPLSIQKKGGVIGRKRTAGILSVVTSRFLSSAVGRLRSLAEETRGEGGSGSGGGTVIEEEKAEELGEAPRSGSFNGDASSDGTEGKGSQPNAANSLRPAATSDSLSLGIKEPVYEVIEVRSDGVMSTKKISRRQLLKSSGLRLRDIRSVDPSLWLMNSTPSLLVREQAILLNLGSLRAIAMKERVLVFDYNRKGGKAFLKLLLPRLNPKNISGGPSMPFELEVVEAALLSRIQRLEQKLMDLEPRVAALLEVLPNRLTADVLEQLRLSKQTLVELGSRAGALKQMLLDLLEDPHEIRRICVMGRNCIVRRGHDEMECSLPLEKQIAEEEEEEIEMLLENYLQWCGCKRPFAPTTAEVKHPPPPHVLEPTPRVGLSPTTGRGNK